MIFGWRIVSWQTKGVKDSWLRMSLALAFVLLAVTQYLGPVAATLYAALASLLLGLGWPHLLKVPARRTLAVVIAISGIVAAVVSLFGNGGLGMLIPVMALAVIATFIVQLFRGTGRPYRLQSLIGTSAAAFLATLGSGWVVLARQPDNHLAYVAAAAGFVGAFFVARQLSAPAQLLGGGLSIAAGIVVGLLLNVPWLWLLPTVLLTASIGFVFRLVAERSAALPSNRSLGAAALTPICALAPVLFYLQVFMGGSFYRLLLF